MSRTLKTTIAAVALSLAGSAAFAQANNGPVTREQVKAELAAAIADGSLNFFDSLAYMYPQQQQTHAGTTLLAGIQEGAQRVAATQSGSGVSREQVRAELAAARRSGELNPFDNPDGVTYRQAPRAAAAPANLAQTR